MYCILYTYIYPVRKRIPATVPLTGSQETINKLTIQQVNKCSRLNFGGLNVGWLWRPKLKAELTDNIKFGYFDKGDKCYFHLCTECMDYFMKITVLSIIDSWRAILHIVDSLTVFKAVGAEDF